MNIVVTGASRGIGFALVKKLSEKENHRVIAIARSQEALHRLEKECQNPTREKRVFPFPFDLVEGDYENLVQEAQKRLGGKVDVLINNAGALVKKPVRQLALDDFDMMFGVNMKAPFLLSKYFLPFMEKGSHIVNISSMAGYPGSLKFPGMTLYSASKGALGAFTEALSAELQPMGVAVNCLAIGAVETKMMRQAFPEADAPVQAHEMAAYIAEFALEGNKMFNGKVLPVAVTTP